MSPQCSGLSDPGYFTEAGSTTANASSCWAGTYNPLPGAGSNASCLQCGAGSFSSTSGSTECTRCSPGTFLLHEGSVSCFDCQQDQFANREGQVVCDQCPEHTSSSKGSATCNTCSEGHYRVDATTSASPQTCMVCPKGVYCAWNTTLATWNVSSGYWRLSLSSPEIRACSGASADRRCIGGNVGIEGHRLVEIVSMDLTFYCAFGYTGPECQLCRSGFYLQEETGLCHACPDTMKRLPLLLSLVIAVGLLLSLLYVLYMHHATQHWAPVRLLRHAVRSLGQFTDASGLLAKCKV